MKTAEVAYAYIEKTATELDAVRIGKDQCVELITGAMNKYHTFCNQEINLQNRLDHYLDEYYPVMECQDGRGTE